MESQFYSANNGEMNDGINGGINSGMGSGINETRQKILALMLTNPNVTVQGLSIELGIDRRNAESHIRALKKNGLLTREGARKNGRWVVTKQL
jgi:predicted HTH transcriptional regulator